MIKQIKKLKEWALSENEDLSLERRLMLVFVIVGILISAVATIFPIFFFTTIYAILLPALLVIVVSIFFNF